jgi:hypothetical protein
VRKRDVHTVMLMQKTPADWVSSANKWPEGRMSNIAASSNEETLIPEGAVGVAPWFAAMEYYALILNRTYKVFVTDQMLCGAKVRGLVSNPSFVAPQMFDQQFWIRTQTAPLYDSFDVTSEQFLQVNSANFQMKWNEITQVEYRSGRKWGMGNVPHSGRLTLQIQSGRQRELILLGKQNGDALKGKLDHFIKARSYAAQD